ncbi:MAG TPA: cytochrome c-type biogenesis protein CcmH, partial [Candidatus Acidoferrum sp.]|nr:cytochrome c-type biogenesis protein CcmH [Candidatus Acidoferrum sp.]
MTKARPIAAITMLAMFAIAPLLIAPVGAQQLSDRAKQVGGKFMCMCSCSQVLTECNHVGCSVSASMLKELNLALSRGNSEDAITQMFVQEFGTKVYAEPPKSGFSLVAWALPSIYLFVGTGVVIFVIFRWRKRPAQHAAPAGGAPGISAELLERARAQA